MTGRDDNPRFQFPDPLLPANTPLEPPTPIPCIFGEDDEIPPEAFVAKPIQPIDIDILGPAAVPTIGEAGGRAYPEPQPVQATDIHGGLNAFAGKVIAVWYDSAHPSTGRSQDIDVEMSDVVWDPVTNVATMYAKPQAFAEPTAGVVTASPFPLREDQPAHHVAVGDAVTVLMADDGTAWFLADDLPFVGAVTATVEGGGSGEDNFGGAGNGPNITVTRLLVSGDPTNAGGTGTYTFGATSVVYNYVRVLRPTGTHQGHRVSGKVWCQRRGAYIYALPERGLYHASIADIAWGSGMYLVNLSAFGVSYPTPGIAWLWGGGASEQLFAAQACNLEEKPNDPPTHELAIGTEVVVGLFGDPEGDPYYAFYAGKGSRGSRGSSGSRGTRGSRGSQGLKGTRGSRGPTGKAAILKLGDKYRALWCMESPDNRFFDFLASSIESGWTRVALDPLFVEACEPDSIVLVAIHPARPTPFALGAVVAGGDVIVTGPDQWPDGLVIPIRVAVTGIRRNPPTRFQVFTEEQARRNAAFWNQPFVPTKGNTPCPSGGSTAENSSRLT